MFEIAPAISIVPVVTKETIPLIPAIWTLALKEASLSASTRPATYNLPAKSVVPAIATSSWKLALPSTRKVLFIITAPVNDVVVELLPSIAFAGIDSAGKLIIFTLRVPGLPEISLAFKNIFPVVASPPIIICLSSVIFAL